jgi:hypothetical protein
MRSTAVLGVALALATGCWELLPGARDPLQDAAHHEQEACPGAAPSYPPGLLSPSAIFSTEPYYLTSSEHGNQTLYLVGVTLALRPFPSVTSEEIERLLICHAARGQLGRSDEPIIPNDPFWVPGHASKISVEFSEGATRVHVRAKDFEGARLLQSRAQALVGRSEAPAP